VISHPPQLNGIEVRHSVTLRFIASAAISQVITFQNLLDTMLLATSATAVFDLFQMVKIRRVRCWALPVIGNATTVEVQFNGASAGRVGDQAIHSDTSMGIQPACVSARPNRRSLAADFQTNAASTAMTLVCPSGTVIDMDLSFRGAFTTAVAAQNVAVGATAGAVYLRGLDGNAASTTSLPPANLIYTI
jgi:hypothetical protein